MLHFLPTKRPGFDISGFEKRKIVQVRLYAFDAPNVQNWAMGNKTVAIKKQNGGQWVYAG
jgi:hypothetical protein